jgi:hypothetical protein
MGGGGLDYYDPAMLLPLGPPASQERQRLEEAKIAQSKAELAKARSALTALVENVEKNPPGPEREKKLTAARQRVNKIQNELIALSDPSARGPVALGVRDSKTIADAEIRVRGEAEQLGPSVPRGFLSLIDVPDAPKVAPDHSGRLELAQWLTSPRNPLTARVMVNRVWQHLFGQGLVTSVDNFGVTGDTPSHPELLDHLASRFMREGWSIKKLVRTLVLTRAYKLSADTSAANRNVDPGNRLVWRHTPRRLDAEEIRDAMLSTAGTLVPHRLPGSAAQDFKVIELGNSGPQAKLLEKTAASSKHRSVYLPLVRGITPRALEVFDFAEQGLVTGSRDTTTVATQALYLLNDPFVRRQSMALAERVLQRAGSVSDGTRIDFAYRVTLGRPATTAEIALAESYLTDFAAASEGPDRRVAAWTSFCQALLASAEFRYVR